MHTVKRIFLILFTMLAVAACSGRSPGPLEGTWKMTGFMPITISFRNGETESMGIIEKVSYEVKGSDVLVTYQDGMAKGTTMRYTMINPNTARTELGLLERIR